eukprot:188874_1
MSAASLPQLQNFTEARLWKLNIDQLQRCCRREGLSWRRLPRLGRKITYIDLLMRHKIVEMNMNNQKAANVPPNEIERLLQLSLKSPNIFILQWSHIENAIKQELYDKISSKFMQMVNGKKRYNDIDQLLNELKKKMNIDENELNYLKQLIKRAKTCFYPEKKQKYSKENTRLVSDILSVHNCFLFSNFHFKQLDINDLKGLSIN